MKSKTTIFLIAVLLACVALVAVRKAGWLDREDKTAATDAKGEKLVWEDKVVKMR